MSDLKKADLTIEQLIKAAEMSLTILKLRSNGTAHYVEKELGALAQHSNAELAKALLQSASAICLRMDDDFLDSQKEEQ